MADGKQNEPKTIGEVLMSVEARQFWEKMYFAAMHCGWMREDVPALCDRALAQWRERFEPKAGD